MKKIIYIAFLLICNLGFSQGYEAKIICAGPETGIAELRQYSFVFRAYNNGIEVDFTTFNTVTNGLHPTFYLSSNLPITSISVYYEIARNFGSIIVGGCSYTETITTPDCYNSINLCHDFNIEVYNTQNLLTQPIDNTFCIENTISLQGNDCTSEIYNWEYNTNLSNPYQSLGVQSISGTPVNADLGSILPNGYTGNVFIRAIVNGKYTNTITYTAIGCSPVILSVVTASATCTYSNNGAFTLTFDRNLEAGENIQSVNLYTAGEDGIFETVDDVNETPIIPNGEILAGGITTVYTYTAGLKPNDYKIKYQLGPDGEAVKYGPITIGSVSSAVNFNVAETDVFCFNANNGSLEITASGGVGNYQYKLNANTWANFSSGNTHTINGLGPDIYNVQVRDGNQCEAQQ